MATWRMTCSCGEVIEMDGDTKEEAVDKVLTSWTPEMVQQHLTEKHPGQQPASLEESRAGFLANATAV